MKVIELEPGDGTRYTIGIEPLPVESAKILGWGGTPCVMFMFSAGDAKQAFVLPINQINVFNMKKYSGMVDNYSSIVAVIALVCVTGENITDPRDMPEVAAIVAQWEARQLETAWSAQLLPLKEYYDASKKIGV